MTRRSFPERTYTRARSQWRISQTHNPQRENTALRHSTARRTSDVTVARSQLSATTDSDHHFARGAETPTRARARASASALPRRARASARGHGRGREIQTRRDRPGGNFASFERSREYVARARVCEGLFDSFPFYCIKGYEIVMRRLRCIRFITNAN